MLNSPSVFTVCLLNIRSLRKHSSDLKCDLDLLTSDILALTGTQLLPADNYLDIRQHLTPFTLYRHDHYCEKFSSLAICIKNIIHITCQEYFPALNAVNFVVTLVYNTLQKDLSFLLTSDIFVCGIDYLPSTDNIDVILGDLNMNYFSTKDMAPLASLMVSYNYVQIVKRPTFISGSLLDHVYIKEDNKANICASVISVYYSDHDAIRITITL